MIIDDLVLVKLPSNAGEELADVLTSRYEKSSTVLTSNRSVDDWPRFLGDVIVVAPLLDRLMHRGNLLKFEGKSWRLKEASRRADCKARRGRVNILRPTAAKWGNCGGRQGRGRPVKSVGA